MSNGRKHSRAYTRGYLKSPAWFARRDAWLDEEETRTGALLCAVCETRVTRRLVELHHITYEGVVQTRQGWIAGEAHEDLMAMHARCHEWVHQMLDRDLYFRRMSSRQVATSLVIVRLQAKLRRLIREVARAGDAGQEVRGA